MVKRHIKRGALIAGAVVAALLFFLCGAALRLLMGPISLGPFAGAIEDSLNHSVSGLVIRFDQTVLEWSRSDGKVNLIVLGAKVFDLNGRIVAQAPKADVVFDAASLFAGKMSVKRFALIGVQLTGMRLADGTLRLGFGPSQSETDLLETIRGILKDNSQGGGSLQSFAIQNARLAFRDVPTGLFVISPDATFALKSNGDNFDASLDAAVEISGAPARISARAVLDEHGSPQHGTVDIKGLSLPALAANSSELAYLKRYAVTADTNASFVMTGGKLIAGGFTVAGSGTYDSGLLKTPLPLDKFTVKGRYDGINDKITFDSIALDGKRSAGTGKGMVDFDWKDGALSAISADIDVNDLRLDIPERFSEPLALRNVSVSAVYDAPSNKLIWRRAQIAGDELSADLSGSVDFDGNGSPAIEVKGQIAPLSVKALIRYWPFGPAMGAREWIANNILTGRLGPFTLMANLPEGILDADKVPDEDLKLDFPFEQMTARYMTGLTPLTGGHGQATLLGNSFHVSVSAAEVGPLAMSNGDVAIRDLQVPGSPALIKAHAEGKVPDVLTLIDEQPSGYAKRFGVAPAATDGHAAVDLDFTVPLLKDLSVDQLKVVVQAKVTDLSAPLDERRRVEHTDAVFDIDNKSLTSEGKTSISGVPFNFKWTEDFVPEGDISTRVSVNGVLDDRARAVLGIADPRWLTGPAQASYELTGLRFRFNDATVHADLTNASLDIPELDMLKKPGVPATATASLRFLDKGALGIDDLVLTGQGLDVKGGMTLDADHNIVMAALTTVKVGPNNDFALFVDPLAGGGTSLRLEGKSLTAGRYFAVEKKQANAPPASAAAQPSSDTAFKEPLTLNAKLDKVVFLDNLALHNVSMAVSFAANQRLTGFTFDAGAPVKGKVTGRFAVEKGVRNLSLESDAAGDFVHAMTGFPSIRNGAFSAHVMFPPDNGPAGKTPPPDYSGSVAMTDITVVDQPFLARLFAAGTLDGPLRLLQGSGISFTKFEAPFSARGSMLTIKDGRASGFAMGATFDGIVDRRDDRVDVTGSLVPVFGINSILGAVPIVGDLLVSKKGEGLIGLTYAMKGSLDEPSIEVNPLSVLTPGIFRRLFEFGAPKETAQQAAPPSVAPKPPVTAPKQAPVPTE